MTTKYDIGDRVLIEFEVMRVTINKDGKILYLVKNTNIPDSYVLKVDTFNLYEHEIIGKLEDIINGN